MIEVFKTNVTDWENAFFLKSRITEIYDCYEVSFDLEDCDRILRVKPTQGRVNPQQIIDILNQYGFTANVLSENYPLPILKSLIKKVPVNNCW